MVHKHARTVLHHIQNAGLNAHVSMDDDGEITVHGGDTIVVVTVNDLIVNAHLLFRTEAPVPALAMISRKLNQRVMVGRLVFPDDGGIFLICAPHRYAETPSEFDSVSPIATVLDVMSAVFEIANEFGYTL